MSKLGELTALAKAQRDRASLEPQLGEVYREVDTGRTATYVGKGGAREFEGGMGSPVKTGKRPVLQYDDSGVRRVFPRSPWPPRGWELADATREA